MQKQNNMKPYLEFKALNANKFYKHPDQNRTWQRYLNTFIYVFRYRPNLSF